MIRMFAMKNFLAGSLSTTANGTAFDFAGPASGQRVYGAMHLTAGSTGRAFSMTLQSATSSGFAAPTTRFTFNLTSCVGSTWPSALSAVSTDHHYWRAAWTASTAGGSTAGSWTGLAELGFR